MKLHLGAGRAPIDGWVNLDLAPWEGLDVVADGCKLPFHDDVFGEILASHVIEHVPDALGLFSELWRVAKAGAVLEVHVPHGSSDVAWTDPTHVRPYFEGSFETFGQPYHWRMEQHYLADWRCEKILLLIDKTLPDVERMTLRKAQERARFERNAVREMRAWLRCVKPARKPSPKPVEPVPLAIEVEA